MQDGGLLLKLSACVKFQNGIVSLDEPLDYLLSCVHQLLVLQPQNKTGRQSEYSLACFGFSLSQENEVGGIPAGESFANAFINLRKSLRSCKLEEYSLDKTQNFCLETPEGEKNVEQARVFLGILEVLMNIAVSDMKNATDANPAEAKNELRELLELYGSLEQSALRKQGGPRKGSMKPSSDSKGQTQEAGTHSNLNLKHGSIAAPPSSQERIPFLTTSNIAYLLEASLKLINTDNISSSQPTSQHRSQGASRKQTIHHFKLASFALRTCLRHLKAFSTESLMPGESQNPLKALVFGDMKVLGGPLLQLMCLLKSTSSSVSTQEKTRNKESRVKKASDEAGDGLIHTSVLCMDMLCKSCFTTKCLSDVLEEMLSVSSNEEEAVDDMDIEMEDIYENESESPESKLIHLFLWKKIRPLLVELLMQTHFREFEVLSGTALFLGGKLPSHLRKVHGTWADLTCRSTKVVHNGAARALATLGVYLCIPPQDLTVGKGMACELLKVTGSEEMDAIDVSDVYFIINTSTKSGIITVLLQLAEATLVDLDWLISKLKVCPLAGNVEFLDGDVNNPRQGNVPRSVLEETLHSRVESLVRMLSFFTEMSLDSSPADHFLRVALRLYKLLAAMTKLCIAPKSYKQSLPSSKFQLLAEVTCRKLTAPLYNFMAVMQRDQQENLQAKGVVNKIKRESKTIPNLIFHMEDYEKYLIQLSKVTKVNLMRHAKRSTARDFKILDTSKKNEQDDNNQPDEANQSDAAISGNESQEESERVQADGSQDIHSEGNVVAEESKTDSDNDSGMRINMARKRKVTSIVQDSDEE